MSDEAVSRREEPPELVDALRERGVLLGLSYRLLGSLADAEDAVQETYLRWHRLGDDGRRSIAHPRAWLIKTASRIGLDMLGTARARREHYVGEWLPEPLPAPNRWSSQGTSITIDPADRVSMDDSVSMALLVVLESMTPAERVAFVLHDVFRYTFPEVADVVGRTPAACRQLASSARRRVRSERRNPVPPAEHASAVRSFKTAWQTGDLTALIDVLDPDVTAITDGGGIVSAASRSTARKPSRVSSSASSIAGQTSRSARRPSTANPASWRPTVRTTPSPSSHSPRPPAAGSDTSGRSETLGNSRSGAELAG